MAKKRPAIPAAKKAEAMRSAYLKLVLNKRTTEAARERARASYRKKLEALKPAIRAEGGPPPPPSDRQRYEAKKKAEKQRAAARKRKVNKAVAKGAAVRKGASYKGRTR